MIEKETKDMTNLTASTSWLLKPNPVYKPFRYPWAYSYWELQSKLHWMPEEVPMGQDVQDYKHNLSPEERNLLTHIFRFFTQSDVEVGKCYIEKYSKVFQPTEVRMMLQSFSYFECFDSKTELLTSTGWVPCPEITDQHQVAQYDLETGKINFVLPKKVVNYDYEGIMHHYHNKTTDICVTPNHDLVLKHPTTGVVKKDKSMNGSWGRNYLYPRASSNEKISDIRLLERLMIAIQADGCVRAECPQSEATWRTVDFNLTKERKVLRLQAILEGLNVKYSMRPQAKGSFRFTFSMPKDYGDSMLKLKNFGWINELSMYSPEEACGFIDELLFWDGSQGKYWYNTCEQAVDKVQALAVLAGISCSKGINYPEREDVQVCDNVKVTEATKTCYVLSFSDRVWRTYPHREEVPYSGKVYCVSVDKQNLVSRRNGKVAITGNTIHIAAYAHLLDTLGLPEVEYQAFLKYKEMKDKFDYLQQFEVDSLESVARTMAVFAGFTEGLQLFASFAILLNFPRFNKMKGMGQIVTWSVRDETIHCEGMIKLFRQFVKEHPQIWTDEFKRTIYQACRDVVEHEDAFIDLAFELGGVEGLEADDVKQYIRYIADRRLMQMGLKPNYNVQENPLPWIDEMLNATEHTNFFEQRATEYSKAATLGTWEEVFPETGEEVDVMYHVYSKINCPQCSAAKVLLTNRGEPFEVIDVTDDPKVCMELYTESRLQSMPVIYKTNSQGERELIGGYLDLRTALGV